MSVDDMGLICIKTKFFQYFIDDLLTVKQPVIGVFLLSAGFPVRHKIAFKSSHLVLAKHRRLGT